jgi:predicted Zn-dependent protease
MKQFTLRSTRQSGGSVVSWLKQRFILGAVFWVACTACAGPKPAALLPPTQWEPFLAQELITNLSELQRLDTLPPYYLAYRLNDTTSVSASFNLGETVRESNGSSSAFQVEVRVGDFTFDNTHPIRENLDYRSWGGYQDEPWPVQPTQEYARKSTRIATDFAYRDAVSRYRKLTANVDIRPAEADSGVDFSRWPAYRKVDTTHFQFPDSARKARLTNLRHASQEFLKYPWIYGSQIDYRDSKVRKRFTDSEGIRLIHDAVLGNISLYAETKTKDGMVLWLADDEAFRDSLPTADTLHWITRIHHLAARLDTLRKAPIMETYDGPVLLMNRAAGVFMHEVVGHRVEGHRQKAVDEGQTFAAKIGQPITSESISLFDDPGLSHWGSTPLNGFYSFDDEGVPAARADIINKGVFRGFLLSRSLLNPLGKSNGHGRAMLGSEVVARMGNTILTSKKNQSLSALRDTLRLWLKAEGREFGLVVHDISGGFTYTQRDMPQSFRLEPLYVAKVFADGRPDQVVRGVDLVGTPLLSLRQITLAGDDPKVFNGHCGAESGWVPVSAVSPSLLLRKLEFESRARDQNRPPILPPPGRSAH